MKGREFGYSEHTAERREQGREYLVSLMFCVLKFIVEKAFEGSTFITSTTTSSSTLKKCKL